MDIWSELGIEPTLERTAIRRAYARRLKIHRPDQDPEGFERLRYAYDVALAEADADAAAEAETDTDADERAEPARSAAPAPEATPQKPSMRVRPRDASAGADPFTDDGTEDVDNAGWAERQSVSLGHALKQGDSVSAIRLLGELLSHDAMSGLDARWQLEQWLLATLSDREVPVPSPAVIRLAIGAFRWREDATRLPAHHQDLVDGLLAELELDEHLESLGQRKFELRYLTDGRALAGWLLGSRHREWVSDYASLSSTTFGALKNEWQELEIFGPDALSRHLASDKYEWWNENVENGPRWFLRLAQFLQTFAIIPVAAVAIFCVAGLPVMLTEYITGSSLLVSFYLPYVGVTAGAVSLSVAATSGTSLFVLRSARRLDALFAPRLGAIDRIGAALLFPIGRYTAWHRSLSPNRRRLAELVVLVLLGCGFWAVLVAFLWMDTTR